MAIGSKQHHPSFHKAKHTGTHTPAAAKEHQYRGTAAQRGYGGRWQKARLSWIKAHPLCVRHHAKGEVVAGTVVDHIKPHRGDSVLFWDTTNWQTLCKDCHDRKTLHEKE